MSQTTCPRLPSFSCAPSRTSDSSTLARDGSGGSRSRRSSSATASRCCAPAGECCPRRARRTRCSTRCWRPGRALQRGDEVRELRPWLYRIAHNTSLNQLRMSGYDFDELQGVAAHQPTPPRTSSSAAPWCARRSPGSPTCPSASARRCWAIAVEGRSQDEVAEVLGLSPGRRAPARPPRPHASCARRPPPSPPSLFIAWVASASTRAEPIATRVAELGHGRRRRRRRRRCWPRPAPCS